MLGAPKSKSKPDGAWLYEGPKLKSKFISCLLVVNEGLGYVFVVVEEDPRSSRLSKV